MLILFILDTTLSPSSSYNDIGALRSRQSRQYNLLKSKLKNDTVFSSHTSDATHKGFGRVSKGLIILCVFIGCTSLFFLHTRRDLPYLNLSNNEEKTDSNHNIPQSKDYTSSPFNGKNQAFSSDEEGMSFIFPSDKR